MRNENFVRGICVCGLVMACLAIKRKVNEQAVDNALRLTITRRNQAVTLDILPAPPAPRPNASTATPVLAPLYRILGCLVALPAVLAFTASSSRALADTPTGQAEFSPLSVENWEVEARKILAAQKIPEAEIEQAIETARAARKASEEKQARTLQMIPLSDENWEAEARALLSKENRSKEEIDDVIEDIRKRKENTANTDPLQRQ